MMSVVEALARRSEEARAVFYSVTAYRHISNVSIERAIELHMVRFGIDMAEFERVSMMYHRCASDTRGLIDDIGPCRECPEA